MITILEHGKRNRSYKMRCKNCGCLFTCNNEDCKVVKTNERKPHVDYDWADDEYVFDFTVGCPECSRNLIVKHDVDEYYEGW